MDITPLKQVDSVGQVLSQLTNLILNRKLKKGDRLPSEVELCRLFDTGRSSVREALSVLRATGVIQRTRRGTVITGKMGDGLSNLLAYWASLNNVSVVELFDVRVLLESETARMAAMNLSDEELEQLARIHEKMIGTVGDDAAYVAANVAFHMTIAHGSGNQILAFLIGALRETIGMVQQQVIQTDGVVRDAIVHHSQILDALVRRDPDAAAQAMRNHLEKVVGGVVSSEEEKGASM